ncbi:unnamed protein product [Paramecium primaurelia]|uniref:Transmembrane protein n=1 Tax=Paramecium primaurelia TaxID=5886 RepID=A0A8S1PD04_PARPR|nr:unnamed protein product [Paramecium primaurelia]
MICALVSTLEHFLNSLIFVIFEGIENILLSSLYKFRSCENIGDNTIKIVLMIYRTVEAASKIYFKNKPSKLKIFAKNPKVGFGGVLIKVLTNYLEIFKTISKFQLQLPSVIQSRIRSVSNPVESMSLSFDCFLISISNFDIIYLRMIWALIMPILYIISFLLLYTIWILISLTKANKTYSIRRVYLIIVFQENLKYLLDSRKCCLQIQYSIPFQLDDNIYFTFYSLSRCSNFDLKVFKSILKEKQIDRQWTRKIWGYLYNEYSQQAYFWEIVKILEKGFMIVFLTFYEDLFIIKAAMIFIITFIYLNMIDEISTLVCETSIFLGMTLYSASFSDNQEIIQPFYIILLRINITFIIIILSEIRKNRQKVSNIIANELALQQNTYQHGEQQQRIISDENVRDNPGRQYFPSIQQCNNTPIEENQDENIIEFLAYLNLPFDSNKEKPKIILIKQVKRKSIQSYQILTELISYNSRIIKQ